jgi:uridine kinase
MPPGRPQIKRPEPHSKPFTMRLPSKIIAIAGPSGSGKSCVALGLAARLGPEKCQGIELDHYYRDLRHLPPAERAKQDFDCPAAWESELLIAHVTQLKQGHSVDIPQYDFTAHLRANFTHQIEPKPFIILEGLFALCYPALRPLIDLGVFIDIDDDSALARRIQRDVNERGRTPDSVIAQFRATVQPATVRHIRPSAATATLLVHGDANVDDNIAAITQRLV